MPTRITKIKEEGYQVSTPGGVKAKRTSLRNAKRQTRLLRAIEHSDWRPTGKKRRKTGS